MEGGGVGWGAEGNKHGTFYASCRAPTCLHAHAQHTCNDASMANVVCSVKALPA